MLVRQVFRYPYGGGCYGGWGGHPYRYGGWGGCGGCGCY